jgi:hypothetical protein
MGIIRHVQKFFRNNVEAIFLWRNPEYEYLEKIDDLHKLLKYMLI